MAAHDALMVSSGLEGIVAATTRLSHVDGERGELVIAGYPVGELAEHATFEETTWLLWHGDLPSAAQLEAFRAELAAARGCRRRPRRCSVSARRRGWIRWTLCALRRERSRCEPTTLPAIVGAHADHRRHVSGGCGMARNPSRRNAILATPRTSSTC